MTLPRWMFGNRQAFARKSCTRRQRRPRKLTRTHFERSSSTSDLAVTPRSARAKHRVFGCGVADCCAQENVGGEVGVFRDARDADGGGHPIGENGSPAMAAVPTGDDGGYGECCGRVSRGEAAALKRRLASVEKGVGERLPCGDV